MNATCLRTFLDALPTIEDEVKTLRSRYPGDMLIAMQLPKLSLFNEVRTCPVYFGRLAVPTVVNILKQLSELPPGSIVAVFPNA